MSKDGPGSCWLDRNTHLLTVTWTWERYPSSNIGLSWLTRCLSKSTTGWWISSYVWWCKGWLQKMLYIGAICKSYSHWASTVVLVQKKDRSLGFCIGLRKLNNLAIKDAYSLPHIDETLDKLQGSQWFSSLDLKSGYWQFEMDEESKLLTVTSVVDGILPQRPQPQLVHNIPQWYSHPPKRPNQPSHKAGDHVTEAGTGQT